MRCYSTKLLQWTLNNSPLHTLRKACRAGSLEPPQSGPTRGLNSNKCFASAGLTISIDHQSVPTLPSWDLQTFREQAFIPKLPALLPQDASEQPPASQSWFHKPGTNQLPSPRNLNYAYLSKHGDVRVPLELTRKNETGTQTSFERFDAPLQLFLDWMCQHQEQEHQHQQPPNSPQPHLYLAQCSLSSLPELLAADLPTPKLVLHAGEGDVYDANIWIGAPPTYTPLHRDPNPNFFLQLAGRKMVRLFPPEVGREIHGAVQKRLGRGDCGRAVVWRGEEMMQGKEREVLERVVWGDYGGDDGSGRGEVSHSELLVDIVGKSGYEATVEEGTALFIPLGWWHSIKGVGSGNTASVNWWFR